VDDELLSYLRVTARTEEQIDLVEEYAKLNDLWYSPDQEDPEYTDIVEINLSELEPNLLGPKRPQDLIPLSKMKEEFIKSVTAPSGNHGYGLTEDEFKKETPVEFSDGQTSTLKTGSLVIAAITSCTNTSNPYVMLGAGLLAKNAIEKGLEVPAYVKTSLAPGSKVVTRYLEDSNLMTYLDQLGFNLVGYGCTTCIGNSGPLKEEIEEAIIKDDLLVSSVLSGNRNFEGRIHPLTKANYLASPPLVVAYALAGTVDINLSTDPLGTGKDGKPVYMEDIWPSLSEITEEVEKVVTPEIFRKEYESVFDSNEKWNEIDTTDQPLFEWDDKSTYIQNPPFFEELTKEAGHIEPINNLRSIGLFGDSVTTDHISPAGAIAKDMPAGQYLQD